MRHIESKEQSEVIAWARLWVKDYPMLEFLHSSQSGVKMSAIQAIRAKKEGMLSGLPDLFLPYAKRKNGVIECAGLYIEMKRAKSSGISKGSLSANQKKVIDYLNGAGYKAIVCYGANEAITAIKDYLEIEKIK